MTLDNLIKDIRRVPGIVGVSDYTIEEEQNWVYFTVEIGLGAELEGLSILKSLIDCFCFRHRTKFTNVFSRGKEEIELMIFIDTPAPKIEEEGEDVPAPF